MEPSFDSPHLAHFGVFKVDLRSGELRQPGSKIRLQDQPLHILALLLEHPGEVVGREELEKRLWPDGVVVDFDHSINSAVKRLRKVLGDDAEHPRYIETLPRHGYRFIAPVETITPGPSPGGRGWTREAGTGEGPLRRHWISTTAGAALTILGVLFALNVRGLRDRIFRGSAPPRIESIAVLPLENLSGDPEQEYFADGMTEELITDLGKISALRIISRTSVMHYKGTKKTLPEIARELNVDAIVEGTVLRSGDRVRITANLLHAPSDRHLWAQTYERDLRDVLTLQSEVARAIADKVKANVTPDAHARLARAGPVNAQAHDAYLKGRFFTYKETRQDLPKAIRYLQQAIQIDPNYAPAYAELAICYYDSSESRNGDAPNAEAAERARATALKALELDGLLALPHCALGSVHDGFDWDMPGAEREFRRAIELDPNLVVAHVGLAWHLTFVGRRDEAIQEANRAVELDPVSRFTLAHQNKILYFTRHYDQAIHQTRRWLEIFPDSPEAYYWLGRAFEAKGLYDEAVAAWQKRMTLQGENAQDVAALGHAYEIGGTRGVWRWELERLTKQAAREKVSPYEFAVRYSLLGEKDKAFEYLEKEYPRRGQEIVFLLVDPLYDNLRSDPRFQALLRRMNFPP